MDCKENVDKINDYAEAVVVKGSGKRGQVSSKTKECLDLVCPHCKEEFEFCL